MVERSIETEVEELRKENAELREELKLAGEGATEWEAIVAESARLKLREEIAADFRRRLDLCRWGLSVPISADTIEGQIALEAIDLWEELRR
jgi:hypothetical protein